MTTSIRSSANPLPSIAVIIAAYNADETIAKAVISALAQPQTAEVVVIDDASDDGTSHAAHLAGGGDPRLAIVRNEQNCGPSASRNIAINRSSAPYIAVLDADDFFLENRFDAIFRICDWDFCADNIVFFDDETSIEGLCSAFDGSSLSPTTLGVPDFIRGNIPNAKKPRGELGFLKPVIRRSFIKKHDLLYDPSCRLGEDFVFYMQALLKGARYLITPECGYAARVRPSSLSGQHLIHDLKVLHGLEKSISSDPNLSKSERKLMKQKSRSTCRRVHHREVLAVKSNAGLIRGLFATIEHPNTIIDILRDKFFCRKLSSFNSLPRLLLRPEAF